MWIMLVTFLFYANPQDRLSNAALATAEFSGKERCEAARTAYLGQFTAISDELNTIARNRIVQGTIPHQNGISVTALCVQK
ncbi:MAG: hypothetical protein WBX25_05450 [Rhodomicrobium sp.]